MASDIDTKLRRLRLRRGADTALDGLTEADIRSVLAKSLLSEPWERRAQSQPYTRYAIGAMEPVDSVYTRISLETGERVAKQLRTEFAKSAFLTDYHLQGSVPLNVHIRGVSDVDVLCLDNTFLVYDTSGSKSQGGYYSTSPKNSITVISQLRTEAERILRDKFPAATVNTKGSKAIQISGGSLPRSVDVVPSHWWDTAEFQNSGSQDDRGVYILDRSKMTTIKNLPFLHIARIQGRCTSIGGNLRKAIRLCKTVKADAIEDGKSIQLPSFDIAAVMYHADRQRLRLGSIYDLAVLDETQRHLDHLARNHSYAKTLMVPDGSRVIFDTAEKLTGLNSLSVEIDNLVDQVAREHRADVRARVGYLPRPLTEEILTKALIP